MKSVLISIQPKWCELIASGKKTVEVRKTKPKLETPFKVYIYCTKNKEKLIEVIHDGDEVYGFTHKGKPNFIKTFTKDWSVYGAFKGGKVIGEFVCNKIEQGHILWVKEHPEYYDRVEEKTQLTYRQMFDYFGESGVGCFWHISNLVIYDKPRELSEFYTLKKCNSCKSGYESSACIYDEDCKVPAPITRPPQSWCYVEGTE